MSNHASVPPRHREWKLGCKVYIGNLAEGASKADIEGAFSKYGPLRNVWVARNPPGFAFVEFEDGRDAEDACRNLDGTRIAGGRIKAEMSHGRTRRGRGPPMFAGRGPPPYMGGHRGGHYNGGHHGGPPRAGHYGGGGHGHYPGPPGGYMDRPPRDRYPPPRPRSRSNSLGRSPPSQQQPIAQRTTARPRTPPDL